MKYIDITHDKKAWYRLQKNERVTFFLRNRSGDLSFELLGEHAEARVIALSTLEKKEDQTLRITQIHRAPNTKSSFVGRSVLSDAASIDWQGLIHIGKNASGSDAHQEMRNLLLSENASAIAIPSLEIETNDVTCGHATTTSTLHPDHLFFLRSRGLSRGDAEHLLIEGFTGSVLERLPSNFLQS